MSPRYPKVTAIQRVRGWLVILGLCALLAPVLAACGTPDDEATATPQPANTTKAVGQSGPTATPTTEPEDEPTATEALANTPEATATATATTEPTSTPAPTDTPAPTPTPLPPPTETPVPTATPVPGPELTEVQVLDVVDGDTLKVMWAGQSVSLRLIGVDTPETVHPTEPVGCFGPEASAFTRQMIERAGWRALLEKDVSETDQYNRLLRYVWLPHPDGTRFLNEELVAQGYAQVVTFPPDVKYTDLFLERQREARENGRGLWGECGAFGVPLVTPTPVPQEPVPPPPPAGGNCDPSYPDVCIPPPPPDLDCGDISERRFRVLPPDPHRFDGDGDGLGCESG